MSEPFERKLNMIAGVETPSPAVCEEAANTIDKDAELERQILACGDAQDVRTLIWQRLGAQFDQNNKPISRISVEGRALLVEAVDRWNRAQVAKRSR